MIQSKTPLLFLVHRIPFPPNKGDKIRSYHLLKFLAEQYDVYLGTFIDDVQDEQYRSVVAEFCQEVHIETIRPPLAKLKSLSGFIRNEALSIPYYASATMQDWVNKIVASKQIKKSLAFSSPMAQFLVNLDNLDSRVMDFVDIDSDKWQQYCQTHKGIMSWIYAREARYLFAYEKQIAKQFTASLFVSEQEAQMFRTMNPEAADKTHGLSNGVDIDYFNTRYQSENPYNKNKKVLVFTGAMDYWANCDAVIWFAQEIFPLLYNKDKSYQFYIVGSNPTEQVQALAAIEGVFVTGRVEDIRPYIQHALLCVAPLRIARGIQNKVLEAMAMGKAVIATMNAMEGIELPEHNRDKKAVALISDSVVQQFEDIDYLNNSGIRKRIELAASQWIIEHYSWSKTLAPLTTFIEAEQ